MGIVKSYQKKTDTTYVYESEAYWDPEKKQSRSKRRLIGKIDKETGEIVRKRCHRIRRVLRDQSADRVAQIQQMRKGSESWRMS